MTRAFYRFMFRLAGWQIKGGIDQSLARYVMIVAPHTSNWDFFIGLAARSILGIDTRYVAKKELFRFPFGWLFRKLGGYPVDRSKNTKFVDSVAEIFNQYDRFSICITPEGTRSYAPKWKTGFYYIAVKAQVPIVMVAFDYPSKQVRVEPPFYPTGNMEEDLEHMRNYFRTATGKHAEKGVR